MKHKEIIIIINKLTTAMEKRISKPNTLYDSNMLYSIEYGELFIYRNEIVGNKTLRTHVNGCICKSKLIMK